MARNCVPASDPGLLTGSRAADLVRSLERLDNRGGLLALLLCRHLNNVGTDTDVSGFVFRLERLACFLLLLRANVNARIARYFEDLDEVKPRMSTHSCSLEVGE